MVAVRCRRVLVGLVLAFVAAGQVSSADASVFKNNLRWQTTKDTQTPADGYTIIPVCIADGSSAAQRREFGTHDRTPFLGIVVGQVRDALRSNWEDSSSVRFVGWEPCKQEQRDHIQLYIHPTTKARSGVGNPDLGKAVDYYETSFKPWGTTPEPKDAEPGARCTTSCECITWRSDPSRAFEYSFSCVRQYAVHEFGHATGFLHEWQHPYTPAQCSNSVRWPESGRLKDEEQPLDPATAWEGYEWPRFDYTIPNLVRYNGFDRDSIMTYRNSGKSDDRSVTWDDKEACADVTGVRFGSPSLDSVDRIGVRNVYPPPAQDRPYDVGVIPDVRGSCPEPTEVRIYMDNEDSRNKNQSSGWTGAINQDAVVYGNTTFEFCKIDGRLLGRIPAPASGSATYAVLRLGAECPPGSTGFNRYHDDEDYPPVSLSWMAGEVGPTRQNVQGTETSLHWCVFNQLPRGATPGMSNFPQLDFGYGVVAPTSFSKELRRGKLHIDDEDTNNDNKPEEGDTSKDRVSGLMDLSRNTTIYLALVKPPPPPPPPPSPPPPCERTRTC